MPYKIKGKCIYKKYNNKKVGCTKGSVKKYMKALQTNISESNLPNQVGDLTFSGLLYSKDKTKIKTEYTLPDNEHILQLYFDITNGEPEYGFAKIVSKSSPNEGPRFEDPQSNEILQQYNLTGDDVENAGQDSFDRIEQTNNKSLKFESLFDKIMNNG